ncbi:MAG: LysM peptidoglycan-binding domain-containing protein [Candidatus Dadabacteria bacterium]|nr:MAG: LysM peptidoglycan-binding domain-containing protein [Candidatus Dadabacteria bacterium]
MAMRDCLQQLRRAMILALAGTLTACAHSAEPVIGPGLPETATMLPVRTAELSPDEIDLALASLGDELVETDDFLPAAVDTTEPARHLPVRVGKNLIQPDPALLGHRELLELFSRDHPLVDKWIDYFTERGREQYARFYGRYLRHHTQIETWLREEGVPPELIWLAFIESGINPRAYSRAHAAGLWQFIASTGRLYGLKRDFWIDERRDMEKATRAAARHLKDLYEQFGSWELALSAYNAGSRRVQRAINTAGTSDYWLMLQQRYALPTETRHYVPKMIAARRIADNLDVLGLPIPDVPPPVPTTTVIAPGGLPLAALAKKLGMPSAELRALNLHIRRSLTPPGRDTPLHIPYAMVETAVAWLSSDDLPLEDWGGIYVVHRGDTLWDIARAVGVSVTELKALNNMRGSRLYPGQRLIVPEAGASVARAAAPAGGQIVVRRGDSLSLIAKRYGTNVAALKQANGLRNNTIFPGQKLKLPGSASEVIVRRGDTLARIAQKHKTTVAALKQVNNLRGTTIYPGQRLKLPSGATVASKPTNGAYVEYTVRRGDTLWDIAQRFGVTVMQIRRANGKWSNTLKPGERLRIPGGVS